jgi:hypothetical protein
MSHETDGAALAALPFGRLALEAIVIVASILLAFGIDAWWAERNQKIDEHEILLGLQEEFSQNRATLEFVINAHQQSARYMEQMLLAIDAQSWPLTEPSIDTVLMETLSPTTTDLGNGVLDGLVSAGRLEILSNSVLRKKVAAWNGIFDEVRDDELNNSKMVSEQIIPFYIRLGVPLGGSFAAEFGSWPVPSRSLGDDPESLVRLLSDPQFRTIIELRYGYKAHLSEEFASAMTAIDEILVEIDRSLN